MDQDDINAMNPGYSDSMNYVTGRTIEGTCDSAQHITDMQKQNEHLTPYAQRADESWGHYSNKVHSW